ncbi:MAG: helix-turn-helix domain-containing protein, partial [Polyangiaceae bacterium]|nr:helix-turn-helix domain-containing protein [Polyangiaceae bacterium]
MPRLAEQLKAARLACKLSQKAVGERLGLPQSHVSAIENGKVDPRLSSVVELARVLDLEPMLIPRAHVLAVRALVAGEPDAPLWSAGDDE